MKNKLLLSSAGKAPEGQIHFVASTDFSNVNFFQHVTEADPNYDFSNLEVYINGELTNQVASNISASNNDDVIIRAIDDHYPWFGFPYYTDVINCIKSIEEPFPLMHQADGNPTTSFNYCFHNMYSLTSIPKGLFDNNSQVTDFQFCFQYCRKLTSIPIGLFDKHTQVTNFSFCFYYCDSLTSMPIGLFNNHTQVTDFSSCFRYCSNLTVNVQVGSTASSINVEYFANSAKEKGTVYCRAGSAAYQAFLKNTTANVNVLTY